MAQRTTSVSVLTEVPQSSHPLAIPSGQQLWNDNTSQSSHPLAIPSGQQLWNENTSQCPSSVPKKIRAGSSVHGGPAARHEKSCSLLKPEIRIHSQHHRTISDYGFKPWRHEQTRPPMFSKFLNLCEEGSTVYFVDESGLEGTLIGCNLWNLASTVLLNHGKYTTNCRSEGHTASVLASSASWPSVRLERLYAIRIIGLTSSHARLWEPYAQLPRRGSICGPARSCGDRASR